jgi:hypothetical protein
VQAHAAAISYLARERNEIKIRENAGHAEQNRRSISQFWESKQRGPKQKIAEDPDNRAHRRPDQPDVQGASTGGGIL